MTRLKKLKIGLWTAFSLCFVWSLLDTALIFITGDCFLLAGPRGDLPAVLRILNKVSLVSAIALGGIHYWTKTRRGWGNKLALALMALSLVVLTAFFDLLIDVCDEMHYHGFTSPDKEHTIVIGESLRYPQEGTSVLVGQRIAPLLYRQVAYADAEIYPYPICDDRCVLDWQEHGLELTLFDDLGGRETISVELG